MSRRLKVLLTAALIAFGVVGFASPALAQGYTGHEYLDGGAINVQFTGTSNSTSFVIYHVGNCLPNCWNKVGHGSVTHNVSTGTYTLIVCDDKADGIGPYIDRDGGSYGTNGNGT